MRRLKKLIRNINYLSKHSLYDQREDDFVYLTRKILSDGYIEYGISDSARRTLNILDEMKSIQRLEECPKSFVRTGDGEIRLMMGLDQPFQRYDENLVNRILQVLNCTRDDMYVAINRKYFIPLGENGNPFYRRYAYDFRNFYLDKCDPNAVYLDATFCAYPLDVRRNGDLDARYDRIRGLFEDKDIVLVCGKGILKKLQYDVFERSRSRMFLEAPARNAWDVHDEIVTSICREASKDQLIIFILGMAGKAMIPELTDRGYMCWDVGHMAKYYDAYCRDKIYTREEIAAFYAPDEEE